MRPPAAPREPLGTDALSYDYRRRYELRLHLDCVRAAFFYESLPILVSASDDGTIRVTNLDGKATVGKKAIRKPVSIASLRGHIAPVLCLVGFERDGKQRCLSGALDGTIGVWHLPAPTTGLFDSHGVVVHHRQAELRHHTDAVWGLDILGDLRTAVSCSADGTVQLWSATTTAVAVSLGDFPISVKTVAGNQFAVGCRSGAVRLFESAAQIAVIDVCRAPILTMLTANDRGQIIAAGDDGRIRVIDITGASVANEFRGHENGISGLCVTGDGEFLITTGHDAAVNAWRMDTFNRLDTVKVHATKFGEGVLCCAAASSKTGKLCFATGGADGSLQIFIKG
jgi:striatin 1/3/4